MSTWREETITVSPDVQLHVLLRLPKQPTPFPTLVLLHFWGGSNATWQPLSTHISDRIPLLIPSLRGWGKSSKPVDPGVYRTIDYANDIIALLNQLAKADTLPLEENGIILAGHSLGGKIAQRVLALNPPVAASMRALVLVAPTPATSFHLDAETLERMRWIYADYDSACTAFRNRLLGSQAARDEALVSRLAADAVRSCREAQVALPDYGAKEDFEAELVEVVRGRSREGKGIKVLVLEGEEALEGVEESVAAVLKEAGAEVEYARLKCGHLIPVEVPQQLGERVQRFVFDVVEKE